MRKSLVAATLIGVCGTASAHSDVCNYSMDMNVNIEEDKVVFFETDGDRYEFIDDRLLINGEEANLNKEQKAAADGLQSSARAMVPKIANIAIEGAEIGLKATTIVMSSLFGQDAQVQQDLIEPIEALTDKIKQNVSHTTFNSEAFEQSMDEAFDEEFEQLIETAVSKYSGKIVGSVLSSVFSGDSEELKDFEFRMENMEREIETYVEANAEELERSANELCADMAVVDAFDNALQSVEGYPDEGLIFHDKDKGVKIGGISVNQTEE